MSDSNCGCRAQALLSDSYAHGVTGGPLTSYPIEAGKIFIP
jgi:hypothetical protein